MLVLLLRLRRGLRNSRKRFFKLIVAVLCVLQIYPASNNKNQKPFQSPVHESLLPLDSWRYVTDDHDRNKMLVFSAFSNNDTIPTTIRLIAVGPSECALQPSLKCLLYRKDGNISVAQNASIKNIHERFNLKYSAQFVECTSNLTEVPSMISIVTSKNKMPPGYKIKVQVAPESSPMVGEFVLCMKPLHYTYNRALWLVEFMEFQRILGVQHFVFYNHTVGPDVQRVLEYYIDEGLASVFPWFMPMKTQKEVRTENMFAALNDCVYRSRHKYEYAVMLDMDEFIVPEQQYNYKQLMQFLLQSDEAKKGNYGSFLFQNVFHYLYWDNDTEAEQRLKEYETPGHGGPYLLTQLKTRRLKDPHQNFIRSKYIVKPEMVRECGNHRVWSHEQNASTMIVPPSIGLSHHYRICEYGGYECLKRPSVIDKTLHRYSDALLPNIFSKCKEMFGKAGCPKAPPLGSAY